MNIDGLNTLACTRGIDEIGGAVKIYPLPHLPVVKDLVPDLTNFYAQHASIEPWLKTETPVPEKEWGKPTPTAPSSTGSMNVSSARPRSTSCPSYWWNSERYLGPAVLLQANRWLIPIRATRRRASGSTILKIRSAFLPLPHDHELRQDLPEKPQPGQGDRRDQEHDARPANVRSRLQFASSQKKAKKCF